MSESSALDGALPNTETDSGSADDMTQHASKKKAGEKRKGLRSPLVVLGLIIAGMVVVFFVYQAYMYNKVFTDDAQVDANIVSLSARVGGQIANIYVRDFQMVHKGDTLALIEPKDYEIKLKQAEAELAAANAQVQMAESQENIAGFTSKGGYSSAQAELTSARENIKAAGSQIRLAEASLSKARSEFKKADLNLVRAKALQAQNAISQVEFENAQTNYDTARASVEQAEAQLAASKDQDRISKARVTQAEGHLTQTAPVDSQKMVAHSSASIARARAAGAQAALEQAQEQLARTKIIAPVDGYLSKLSIQEGQSIQPGQLFANLTPFEPFILANFKETQLDKIRPKQKVDVEVDAFPGRTFEGSVESVSAATGARFSLLPTDNASGNFVKVVQRVPVKIIFNHLPKDMVMQAGLSANVTIFVR